MKFTKMERITQKKGNDCGVACVAMIIQKYAGCPAASSYDAAKAVMFGLAEAGYTNTEALRLGLESFGITIDQQRRSFRKKDSRNMGLEFDAIIATTPRKNGYWHWLVWDASELCLFDPNPDKIDPHSHSKASHYIKIMNFL